MFHRYSWRWLLVIGVMGTSGCGDGGQGELGPIDRFIDETGPVDLRDSAVVATAASYSDPDTVLLTGLVYPLLITATGNAGCPRFVDESDLDAGTVDWRLEGDCTAIGIDGIETHYQGSIVARGAPEGTVIRYADFRATQAVACDGAVEETVLAANGMVELPYAFVPTQEQGGPDMPMNGVFGEGHYEIQVLFEARSADEACNLDTAGLAYDAAMDFLVEVRLGDDDIPQLRDVFEIKGRAAVRGDIGEVTGDLGELDPGSLADVNGMPGGAWWFSAEDYTFEHMRSECFEPLEGTLSLRAGGNVATIRADGDVRCAEPGEPQCAPWSLNRVMQPGEVCGFTAAELGCAAGPDAPPPWGAVALLLGGLVWQRCRRRERP